MEQKGPCFYSQYRHDQQMFDLRPGRESPRELLVTLSSDNISKCILQCLFIFEVYLGSFGGYMLFRGNEYWPVFA